MHAHPHVCIHIKKYVYLIRPSLLFLPLSLSLSLSLARALSWLLCQRQIDWSTGWSMMDMWREQVRKGSNSEGVTETVFKQQTIRSNKLFLCFLSYCWWTYAIPTSHSIPELKTTQQIHGKFICRKKQTVHSLYLNPKFLNIYNPNFVEHSY